jgi:hypothetical protein
MVLERWNAGKEKMENFFPKVFFIFRNWTKKMSKNEK